MAEPAENRRATLRALALSLLAGGALWRFLTPRRTGAGPDVLRVAEADVPHEGALVLPERRCAVVRRGDGFQALDLTCTHLGCTVTATPQGFACPCHGSRFTSEGQVLNGPAPRSLRPLALERRGGELLVTLAGRG